MQQTREPFYFLDNLVNVLIIDDDSEILKFLSECFKPLLLYKVQAVTSAQQAEKILSSPPRIHVCISDLGIIDIKNDEFFLLKQFGKRVAFVIFTGRTSPIKGFDAHTLGAKAVLEKSGEFSSITFIKTINHLALLNIINPKYEINKDTLSLATNTLFSHSPLFVSQWAQCLGMTDRALRHIWTKNLGANAKIILATYHIFNAAFMYYESIISGKKNSKSLKSYQRLEEFFHLHKSTITDYIAYGNVASLL